MRKIIQELNKASIANATGISYGRLRKYASGVIEKLSNDEIQKIHLYLLQMASYFNIKENI